MEHTVIKHPAKRIVHSPQWPISHTCREIYICPAWSVLPHILFFYVLASATCPLDLAEPLKVVVNSRSIMSQRAGGRVRFMTEMKTHIPVSVIVFHPICHWFVTTSKWSLQSRTICDKWHVIILLLLFREPTRLVHSQIVENDRTVRREGSRL